MAISPAMLSMRRTAPATNHSQASEPYMKLAQEAQSGIVREPRSLSLSDVRQVTPVYPGYPHLGAHLGAQVLNSGVETPTGPTATSCMAQWGHGMGFLRIALSFPSKQSMLPSMQHCPCICVSGILWNITQILAACLVCTQQHCSRNPRSGKGSKSMWENMEQQDEVKFGSANSRDRGRSTTCMTICNKDVCLCRATSRLKVSRTEPKMAPDPFSALFVLFKGHLDTVEGSRRF